MGWRLVQAGGRLDWVPPEGFCIQFEGEQAELFIGGVYVRLFLKNSQFPLRHPKVCNVPHAPLCTCLDLNLDLSYWTGKCQSACMVFYWNPSA